ncbi:MAG: NAD-dependent epimerase/dehydratase family protein [Microthrixaceae bacterium]
MRVLVTGGAGFIGSNFVRRLVNLRSSGDCLRRTHLRRKQGDAR